MAYLGKTPSQAVRSRYYFTATGGETSLSGADDNSNVLTFTDGNYVDVSLNGVTLVAGTDYNTTTANTIGGLTALVASDVVEVVVYDTFSVFSGNVSSDFSVGGNLTVTGTSAFGNNIDVTGTVTADGLTVDGDATISSGTPTLQLTDTGGTNQFATFKQDGSNLKILSRNNTVSGGILMRRNVGGTETDAIQLSANGDVSLYDSTGVTQGFYWDASTQRLGVGSTSPEALLHVEGASTGQMMFRTSGSSVNKWLIGKNSSADFSIGEDGNEWLYVERDSGNVGIGTSSPSAALHILDTSTPQAKIAYDSNRYMNVEHATIYNVSGAAQSNNLKFATRGNSGNNNITFFTGGTDASGTSESERLRIDSSGNLLVGGTSLGENGAVTMGGDGRIYAIRASDTAGFFGRTTTDGSIVNFTKDGSTVGSIGAFGGDVYIGTGDTTLRFADGDDAVIPRGTAGAARDGAIDLGISNNRFKDLYLSGGVYAGSGFGSSGQLLTSNGTTATWQDAPAAGAGYFQGENGVTGDATNGLGDIFRVHEDTLNTNVTIASGNNALCASPLTIATGVTLTVNGNLSIV